VGKLKIRKDPHLLNLKNNTIFLLIGTFVALILLRISSGLGILNPKNTNWLSIDDGASELSWEFFRRQPIFQFPIGVNPKYGLEISNTIAFDGQIPIFSLFFHLFADYLPPRFQYYGLFIFITMILNYYFATKIFTTLGFNRLTSMQSALLLSTSPVILDRYIDFSHYSLISSWIIFVAIILLLKSDTSFFKWLTLFNLTILVHLYFLPIIFLMYLILIISKFKLEAYSFKYILQIITNVVVLLLSMFSVGYFYRGISGQDYGYGVFRSTLSSLFDASGWSRFVPDIPQLYGANEGFSYIGLPSILLILLNLIFIRKSKINYISKNFKVLIISSIILFVLSLSTRIAFGNFEIITISIPKFINDLFSIFRSSGRFSWLLVFSIFILLIYNLYYKLTSSTLHIFLTIIIIFTFYDYYPKISSQKNIKFKNEYKSNLSNKAWRELNQCYDNIHLYPPAPNVENAYNFVRVANDQKMGINTGAFARTSFEATRDAYTTLNDEFKTGVLRNNSFYVFTNAGGIPEELVKYQENLALHTIPSNTGFGLIDGYTFIAPNLKNCSGAKSLKEIASGYGAKPQYIYEGGNIYFGKNEISDQFVISGFSNFESWGIWTVDTNSNIVLNVDNLNSYKKITFEAKDWGFPKNTFNISINNELAGSCSFENIFSLCTLVHDFSKVSNNILVISISPTIIKNPKILGLSMDDRNLGLGLRKLYLN
jgi:hypothetical protein